MKIERIETYPLFYPLKQPYGDANGFKKYRTCFLFRIITDSGYEGWGEAIDWLPTLELGFKKRIIPYLLGKKASDRQTIVNVISKWHKRIAVGISMALTEIISQHANLSICELWGGNLHDHIPVYASFQSYTAHDDWMAKSVSKAERELLNGFRSFKVKIGGRPLTEDQQHIEKLQHRIGKSISLILDANQSYDQSTAKAWEKKFKDWSNMLWFEEPMPIHNLLEYKLLRTVLSVPVSGGENLKSVKDFHSLLSAGAIDIIQPDINHHESIEDYRTTLLLARALGFRVSSHTFDGGLSRLYTLFAHACLPSWSKMEGEELEPVEWDVMENPLTEVIPIAPVNGYVKIPTGTGLGIELDMNLLHRLRWDGSVYR